jgi:Predicted outer membrane protein
MKRLKKLTAILTAAIMMIAMSMPVLAAVTPLPTDTAAASVTNVERTATVTAYQIVKAQYNVSGFIGYEANTGVTLADILKPTSTEVTALAAGGLAGLPTVSMTTTDTTDLATFSADLSPGYWIVLVTGTIQEVYNPMLIGVYYSEAGSDNTMQAGSVDANSNWTLETMNAYAKSTDPSIEKSILSPGSGNANGDDVAIGDTVDFQIATAIPSYSEQYSTVLLRITDTLSAGLELDQSSIVVTAGGAPLAASNYTLTSTSSGFVVTIDSDYALANGNQAIVITYSAELTAAAGLNFDPNTNTAVLEYTNDPNNVANTSETEDTTYTYTFAIGANLFGTSSETWNKQTQELIKGEWVTTDVGGTPVTTFERLAGATFELTNTVTGEVYTSTSNALGELIFTGLDAGTYNLVETVAPDGFTLNSTVIPVVITATYNPNGTLASYTITVDGSSSTYEAVYQGDTSVITDITVIEENPTQIPNTKLVGLPSTGGMGTYIFTILGVAIISVASILLYINKKKA